MTLPHQHASTHTHTRPGVSPEKHLPYLLSLRPAQARDVMKATFAAQSQAVQAAEAAAPPGTWKWAIRKSIWDYMEENDIARCSSSSSSENPPPPLCACLCGVCGGGRREERGVRACMPPPPIHCPFVAF